MAIRFEPKTADAADARKPKPVVAAPAPPDGEPPVDDEASSERGKPSKAKRRAFKRREPSAPAAEGGE